MNFTIELTEAQQEAIAQKQALLKAEAAVTQGKTDGADLAEAKAALRAQRQEYRDKYRHLVIPLEALGLDIGVDSVTVRPGQTGTAVAPGPITAKAQV